MKRIMLLLAVLALAVGAFSCGGGGAGSSSSPSGENPGIPSVVQLSASHIVAQTNASITLHAKVLDGNGIPLANVPVTFTNLSEPFGVINAALKLLGISKPVGALSATVANTDGNGIASAKLSSTTAGFATIVAQVSNGVGTVRDRKTFVFTSASTINLQPRVDLDVSKDGINFNVPGDNTLFKGTGDNQRVVRATVRDRLGVLAPGASVTFGSDFPFKTSLVAQTCSDGSTSCNVIFPQGNTATTDINGQASVLVQVNPAVLTDIQTVLNITARAVLTDNSVASTLTSLFLSPVTISTGLSSVTATPSIVGLGGTSSVTGTVILNTGGPAPDGTAVNFTTAPLTGADPLPCGFITPFSQLLGGVTTPAATFTAPLLPGTCRVTGKAGGVIIGTADIVVNAPLSVQPGTQTVNGGTGGTATFTIFGGLPGYTVTSANPVIAFNTTAGNGSWTVPSSGGSFVVTVPAGTSGTSVVLTVRDSGGTTVAATLTIAAPSALRITPSVASIASSGIAQTLSFTITGGVPGPGDYITTSSDPSKAFDSGPGDGLWIGTPVVVTFPAGVTAGTVTLNVFDSLGATTTATITILAPPPAALKILPALVTVVSSALAQPVDFTIIGGTPPYITTSTDPTKAFDTAAGDGIWSGTPITVNFPANVATGSVTLNVSDSVAGTASATITIIASAAAGPLNVTPVAVSVTGVAGAGDNVLFTITGGVPPYGGTAFSNNTAVVPNAAVAGSTFTVTPNPVAASTPVTFTVIDNVGTTDTAVITVTPFSSSLAINPSTIAVDTGTIMTFTIIGGFGPFTVYTSDSGIVSLASNPITVPTLTPTFTATAGGAGSATITVVDSDSKTVTVTVTVNLPTPDFTLSCAPAAVNSVTPSTCTLTSLFGYATLLNPLACSPTAPTTGGSCAFAPPAVTPTGGGTPTILTYTCGVAAGPVSFDVVATDGTITHTFPMTVTCP